MVKLIVTAEKLNKRTIIPARLPDNDSIAGVVLKGYSFNAIEITNLPNPALGKWYRDQDQFFYWGGGVMVVEEEVVEQEEEQAVADNSNLEGFAITPVVKRKIEQVINAFESGSAKGNYSMLVRYDDYTVPGTNSRIRQVTFGRSQTTEFGHLKALIQDYVDSKGIYEPQLSPYLERIGEMPSLSTDEYFCSSLVNAGKSDPIMEACQDRLFETKYYHPAYHWFIENGFTLPLSLLVIYDSKIHSGGILPFLRKRFATPVPINGGDEKGWINQYVNVRHQWLANHSDALLRKTIYRTLCFKSQIETGNWNLQNKIMANGIPII